MISTTRRFAQLLGLVLAAALPVHLATAEVTFFGSVTPDPPGDGNVESTLLVGVGGDDNPDLQGYVRIDNGTQIEYDELIVGDDEDYRGEVIIDGVLAPGGQSRLTLEEAGSSSNATVQVGRQGSGQLTVSGGGSLLLTNNNADLVIGVKSEGVGTMTVAGTLSLAVIPDSHIIGDEGIGRMEILDGGMVLNSDTSNTAVIGGTLSGSGTVLVDGQGSTWKINDDLTIGDVGVGTLTVSNHGLIDADLTSAVTLVGARGRLEIDGGTFAGSQITVNGYLGGAGLVRGAVTTNAGAVIDVPSGGLLQFTGAVTHQGSLRVGGETVFLDGFSNLAAGSQASPGRITLESGTIRFSQALTNNGVIAAAAGTNHLHGAITNGAAGAIVVASDTVATFHDPVDIANGSLELLAGANALFLSDLQFDAGGVAALQIDNANAGPAQIHVSGAAALAGELDVNLASGFVPTSGDSFQLLLAAGGVSGNFDSVVLPTLDSGLLWGVDYSPNSVMLNVLTAFAGDFNFDGKVDGEDLTGVPDGWQSRYGNDLNGSDFLTWQQQFGNGASQAVAQSVPEPSALSLVIVTFGALLVTRTRQ